MKHLSFVFMIILLVSCGQEGPKVPKEIPFPKEETPPPQAPAFIFKWENDSVILGNTESGLFIAWDKKGLKELWNLREGALAVNPWVVPEDLDHVYTLGIEGLLRKRRLDNGTLVWETTLPQSFTPWTVQWSKDISSFLGPEGQSAQVDNLTGRLISHREAPLPLRKNYWWSRGLRFPEGLDSSIGGFGSPSATQVSPLPPPIQDLISDGTLKAGDVLILPESGGPWFLDLEKAPRYLVWSPVKASVRTLRVEGNEGLPVKLSHWDWKMKRPLISTGGYGDMDSGLRLSVKAGELTVIMVEAQSDEAPITRAQLWWR